MDRNRVINAARQLAKVQEETRTYLRARGSYGSSKLYIVDEETGEEISYQEALLLQPTDEKGGE
jgi:hypothetical protein